MLNKNSDDWTEISRGLLLETESWQFVIAWNQRKVCMIDHIDSPSILLWTSPTFVWYWSIWRCKYIGVFPQYVVNEFIEFDDKKLELKGFDPRISSVEYQFANHYSMKCDSSIEINLWIAIIFNGCIIAFGEFAEFSEFINSASYSGKTRLKSVGSH